MVLDGYVDVARNDNITFLNGTVDNSFYNKYRVCIRYNGHVSVTLAGQTIVTSSAGGDYDATLVCQDDNDLQQGLLPLTVQYASDPTQQSTILQLFIIPISQVWETTNSPDPNNPYQYTYNCSCCGLFGSSDETCDSCGPCCEALDTCSFMTASCSGQAQTGNVLTPPSSPSPEASPVSSPSPTATATPMLSPTASPTASPAAAPTATSAATPAATAVPSCYDVPPDSQFSCSQQQSLGKCGDPFMFTAGAPAGGYCAATCGRCPSGTSPSSSPSPASTPAATSSPPPAETPFQTPSPTPAQTATPSPPETETPVATTTPYPIATPAPTLASCTDIPPNTEYTCQEQQGFGKCGDAFMFTADAPLGGYCAATCGRCPSSSSPAAEVTPAATPTPSPTQGAPIVFIPAATPAPTAEASPSPVATTVPAATATPAATASVTPLATASPTATPVSTSAAAPSPGQTSPSSVCVDIAPDSQYSCQQQQGFGKCGDAFMFVAGAPAGGYCAATCGRCPPGTSPFPVMSPAGKDATVLENLCSVQSSSVLDTQSQHSTFAISANLQFE